MKNNLFLRGQVVDEVTFLHEFNEEKFYQFSMRTDFLENFSVRIPERLQKSGKIEKWKEICLYGDLQSYFDRETGKIRLFCLGDMIGRYKKFRQLGAELYITNPSQSTDKILSIGGVYTLMPKI